jgi:hypothetical protein
VSPECSSSACNFVLTNTGLFLVLEDLATGSRLYYHALCEGAADCFWRLVEA